MTHSPSSAQSVEHCINCGMAVDPKCKCSLGRAAASAQATQVVAEVYYETWAAKVRWLIDPPPAKGTKLYATSPSPDAREAGGRVTDKQILAIYRAIPGKDVIGNATTVDEMHDRILLAFARALLREAGSGK